jgi:hypothetical protein
MKTLTNLVLAAAFLALSAPGVAAVGPGEDGRDTLRGQVIDLSCKVVHDLAGEDHRMCAQVCADAGVPLAILGEDGHIYHAVSTEMPSSGDELNALLRPHAERSVTIEGRLVERAGVRGIVIESVRAN